VSPARLYRVSALVLRQRNLGEADRIVGVLTRERGKLSAVAKGVRKPRSKLAGGLQLFCHARLQLAAGRSLEVITQVEPLDLFYPLRADMARYLHASYVAELVDALTEESDPDPVAFELTRQSLAALARGGDPPTIARAFELKLLGRFGYGPELETCVGCGAQVGAAAAGFSPSAGGVLCARCRCAEGAAAVAPEALRAMRELLALPLEALAGRRLSARAGADLGRVMRAFVDYRLERPLRSAAFLAGPMG